MTSDAHEADIHIDCHMAKPRPGTTWNGCRKCPEVFNPPKFFLSVTVRLVQDRLERYFGAEHGASIGVDPLTGLAHHYKEGVVDMSGAAT